MRPAHGLEEPMPAPPHSSSAGTQLSGARLLTVCCGLFLLWRLVRVATAPLGTIVQFVPDDAFYYLAIAHRLAIAGQSSFDGGQTSTTGYHVLWAWLCEALVWAGARGSMPLLRAMIWLSGALALTTYTAATLYAWRRRCTAGLLALAVIATSFSSLNNLVSGMEWSAVVFVGAATLWATLRAASTTGHSRPPWIVLLVILGFLGSLARSDHGAADACLLLAALWLALTSRQRQFLPPTIATVFGAVAGVAVVLWRDWRISGQLTQGSARMKSLWSDAGGRSPLPFLLAEARTFLFVPGLGRGLVLHRALLLPLACLLTLAALLAAGGLRLLSRRNDPTPRNGFPPQNGRTPAPLHRFLLLSAALTFLLYTGLYSINSLAMQPWYTANVTVSAGVLLWLLFEHLHHLRYTVLTVAAPCIVNIALYLRLPPVYAAQINFLELGEHLRPAVARGETIGFSDTGIVSFVAGGRIINTDGLVNDSLVRYAPTRLPCYIFQSGITLFNGFGPIADRLFPLPSPATYATPDPVHLHDGTVIHLWHVDRTRLAALAPCTPVTPAH